MKSYQYDILFWFMILGGAVLLFGPGVGFDVKPNPITVSGYTAMTAFVLNHRGDWVSRSKEHIKKKIQEKRANDAS